MVLQGHVANKNHHISITRVSVATKLGRMITSLNGLLPIMLHDPLITWPCEIQGSLIGGGSARKRLTVCRILVFQDFNRIQHGRRLLFWLRMFIIFSISDYWTKLQKNESEILSLNFNVTIDLMPPQVFLTFFEHLWK